MRPLTLYSVSTVGETLLTVAQAAAVIAVFKAPSKIAKVAYGLLFNVITATNASIRDAYREITAHKSDKYEFKNCLDCFIDKLKQRYQLLPNLIARHCLMSCVFAKYNVTELSLFI